MSVNNASPSGKLPQRSNQRLPIPKFCFKDLPRVGGFCRCQTSLLWALFSQCSLAGLGIQPSQAQKPGTPVAAGTRYTPVPCRALMLSCKIRITLSLMTRWFLLLKGLGKFHFLENFKVTLIPQLLTNRQGSQFYNHHLDLRALRCGTSRLTPRIDFSGAISKPVRPSAPEINAEDARAILPEENSHRAVAGLILNSTATERKSKIKIVWPDLFLKWDHCASYACVLQGRTVKGCGADQRRISRRKFLLCGNVRRNAPFFFPARTNRWRYPFM